MTWFLIVGALMTAMPSEDACNKLKAITPGSQCQLTTPGPATVVYPQNGWRGAIRR